MVIFAPIELIFGIWGTRAYEIWHRQFHQNRFINCLICKLGHITPGIVQFMRKKSSWGKTVHCDFWKVSPNADNDFCLNLNIIYWKKVELCNSLFESLEVIGVFPFSLGNKLGSWAARGAAWALGWKSYPRYKRWFYTIWRWLERSRINGFQVMRVFVKR